jgi:hypothetical protein
MVNATLLFSRIKNPFPEHSLERKAKCTMSLAMEVNSNAG